MEKLRRKSKNMIDNGEGGDLRIRSPLRSSCSSLSTLAGAVDQASRMTNIREEERIALGNDLEM